MMTEKQINKHGQTNMVNDKKTTEKGNIVDDGQKNKQVETKKQIWWTTEKNMKNGKGGGQKNKHD